MALTAAEQTKLDEIIQKQNDLTRFSQTKIEIENAQAFRTGGGNLRTIVQFSELDTGNQQGSFSSLKNGVADNLLSQILTYVNSQIVSLESDLSALLT